MDLIILIAILIIPAIAEANISRTYQRYLQVGAKIKLSGVEVARKILDANGLKDVYVVETKGVLSDHYDPTRKVVRLSKDIFHGESIASVSVAAHECGHAIQDKEGYGPLRFRSLIYPTVNAATSISYFIIVIGLLMQALNVVYLGIAFTAMGLLFQVVTLPVEFDASRRAIAELEKLKIVTTSESDGAREMFKSAALTYVAGVLASILQILRLLLLVQNRDD